MRAEPFSLGGMPALRWGRPSRQGILYLHGQGGSKAEAAFFAAAAADAGWQTVSVDLPGHGDRESEAAALVPWQVVPELRCALAELRGRWDRVGLFGSSLGAWFGLLAYPDAPLAGALFLSSSVLVVERTPIRELAEIPVPASFPRDRSCLKLPEMVELKEHLIDLLRKQVTP
jgi:pimeloyl-ACP methyl ester carboxylesterase